MPEVTTLNNCRMDPTGLLRCCVETVKVYIASNPDDPAIDTEVDCRICDNTAKLRDGMWTKHDAE